MCRIVATIQLENIVNIVLMVTMEMQLEEQHMTVHLAMAKMVMKSTDAR